MSTNMNPQSHLVIPIPILQEIILLASKRVKICFRQTCKLFQKFVDLRVYTTFTTTLCGSGEGFEDGVGKKSKLNAPCFGCLASTSILYFTDSWNDLIRCIDLNSYEVKTICGTPQQYGFSEQDEIKFYHPTGIDLNEEESELYISDSFNHLIRKVNLKNGRTETICGSLRIKGGADGVGKNATFRTPKGLVYEHNSKCLFVADCFNHSIRRISLKDGSVQTICGIGKGYQDGSFEEAMFACPCDVEWNPSTDELYVADRNNHVIRVASMKDGRVRTLCGTPEEQGYEDGLHNQAKFNFPSGLSLDRCSNYLYVVDWANHVIRKVSLSGEVRVSTVCGTPSMKHQISDGVKPTFCNPLGVIVDNHSSSLYVLDSGNNLIRKVIDRTRVLQDPSPYTKKRKLT